MHLSALYFIVNTNLLPTILFSGISMIFHLSFLTTAPITSKTAAFHFGFCKALFVSLGTCNLSLLVIKIQNCGDNLKYER
uniref:Uncharacterized protein n=1 Tax=Rhizophora mucronata TaxID=61149 RepID=A0A2P2QT61_RHIMU